LKQAKKKGKKGKSKKKADYSSSISGSSHSSHSDDEALAIGPKKKGIIKEVFSKLRQKNLCLIHKNQTCIKDSGDRCLQITDADLMTWATLVVMSLLFSMLRL